MLLITTFVEIRVVAGRGRKRAGSPQAVSRRPCCAVALRRTAWSEHDMGAAWARHAMCESALKEMFHARGMACLERKKGAIGCTAILHRMKISSISSRVYSSTELRECIQNG